MVCGAQTDFLLGYTEYVNNFDKALAMLSRCTKSSPEFALFVRNCEARPGTLHAHVHCFVPGVPCVSCVCRADVVCLTRRVQSA